MIELFWTFFKIGLFTFGGGYAMLPLVQREVQAHGWMTAAELVNFIAVSESTPGSFAVNVSTYVGAVTAGAAGAAVATLGVVMPSFLIILAIAGCYRKFCKNRIVNGCMTGLRPAVVGMIATAAVSVSGSVFFPDGFSTGSIMNPGTLILFIIAAVMLVLSIKKVHPIIIILISALAGILCGYAGIIS